MPNTAARKQDRPQLVPMTSQATLSPASESRPRGVQDGQEPAITAEPEERSVREPRDSDLDKDEIATEAYLLYEARGCQDGYDVEDWLSAEEIVRQRLTNG